MNQTQRKRLLVVYSKNESSNNHSDNIVLLAKNFGTKKDKEVAARLVSYINKNIYYPDYGSLLSNQIGELNKRLYPKLINKPMAKKSARNKKPTPAQLKARKQFAINIKKVSALVKSGKAKTSKQAWKQIKK